MSEAAPVPADLLTLYDDAVPHVYGYLRRRCGSTPLAEDLTSETFFAAVDAARRAQPPQLTTAWLMTVARNKLVDHWRRQERDDRALALVAHERDPDWIEAEELDPRVALDTLAGLGPHHRAALTLRYLDGLSVPTVAAELGRSVHATEALLMRAKHAFRGAYLEGRGSDD